MLKPPSRRISFLKLENYFAYVWSTLGISLKTKFSASSSATIPKLTFATAMSFRNQKSTFRLPLARGSCKNRAAIENVIGFGGMPDNEKIRAFLKLHKEGHRCKIPTTTPANIFMPMDKC